MASFDDWLAVTDPRVFSEALAERFRLSSQELQRTRDALAPAFALGFERAMANPASWTDLSSAFWGMVPGFQSASRPAGGALPGEIFTKAFFGSDALASAVARQASMLAGIAPDTVEKLMPGLAMLTMQTLARSTLESMSRNAPRGLPTGDFATATAEMMRRSANAVEALSRPSDARVPRTAHPEGWPEVGMPNAFADALKATLAFMQPGAAAPAKPPEPAKPAPGAANPMAPFAAMFDAFAQNLHPGVPAGEAAEPPLQAADNAPAGDATDTGRAFQDGYAREMAALFERYAGQRKAG